MIQPRRPQYAHGSATARSSVGSGKEVYELMLLIIDHNIPGLSPGFSKLTIVRPEPKRDYSHAEKNGDE